MATVEVKRVASPERERITLASKELADLQCKVGFFPSAQYADGTPVAYVAAIQEFGYAEGGIPPRPFFRPTIDAQQQAWRDLVAKAVRGIPSGKRTAKQVMEALGSLAAGDIRKTIVTLESPPLAPSTIYARQHRKNPAPNSSVKPLVDTRVMYPAVQHVVETGAKSS